MRKLLLILFLFFSCWGMAQTQLTRTIKGQIVDAKTKEPLPGATVFIDPDAKEAKDYSPQGTASDVQGNFLLTLPVSVKYAVVSFVGYEALKLDISQKNEFKIELKEQLNQLEEVVVMSTGYQKIDKRKVTSAMVKVEMDDIQRVGVASVDQLLEGQVAGMTSVPVNGAPGSPNKIRIRSTVSLSGSQDPLWVVDGMILEGNDIPSNFSDKDNIDNLMNTSIAGMNPSDIEDITILKDAAATAIYGARAANGVIVITTKKGRKGKPVVSASLATFITTKPDLSKLNLMNASEKVDFELGIAARPDLDYRRNQTNTGEVYRILSGSNQVGVFQQGGFDALSSQAQSDIDKLRTPGTNWGDEIYRTAINQQYNFSVSGGGDLANYYFSGGYFNEQGTTKGTGFERFNATLKTDFNLHAKLKLGVSMFFTESTRKSYISDSDGFTNPARYTRNVNPYLKAQDENGRFIYDKDIENYNDNYLAFNFLEESQNTDYSLKNRSLKPMVSLNYKPLKGLEVLTQLSMQLENSKTEKMADKNSYFVRKYREKSRYAGGYFLPEGGVIQNWNSDMSQYQWKLQAEYRKRFREMHEIDVMAGMEMRGSKNTEIHTKGFGFDSKSLTTKPLIFPEGTAAINDESFRQYRKQFYEDRFLSYYMTASYSYMNRYTLFGSIRYDGSNMFGVDRKYKYLPLWALSAAWNVNRESFLEDVEWLSNLKLRVSYGLQGNVDKNTSPFIVGDWGNVTILPGTSEPNVDVTSPPNQYLRWEKTKNWDGGIELGVLSDRITVSLDGYYRVSDDLIGYRSLPGENGFDFASMNWAKVTNRGFELSLSTVNVRTKNFRWSTDFNLAQNKSRVDRIHVRDNSYAPSTEGYSVGALFALKTAGLDEKGIPMFWKGDEKVSFNDFYGLEYGYMMGGLIPFLKSSLSAEEYRKLFTYVGTTEPKFTGGLINRFYYKNFDLTVSAGFVIKQTVQETPFYNPTSTSPGQNYSKKVFDIWSPSNTDGKYPALLGTNTEGADNWAYQWLGGMDPGNSFRNYDMWFKTMSYMRINSIRLGYSLPDKFLKKVRLSSARLSFEARNPFVFGTSWNGYFDPETYGSIYAQPLAKTFSCGLDLTF